MKITISLSCETCRKCKPTVSGTHQEYTCKHSDEPFYYLDHWPCEHWLPSKTDLRAWIQATKNKMNK